MAAVYKLTTGYELHRFVRFPFIPSLLLTSSFLVVSTLSSRISSLPSSSYPLVSSRSTGGKPTRATYEYASRLLNASISAAETGESVDMGAKSPKYEGNVYMVGDNPASDIAGALHVLFSPSVTVY